MYGLSNGTNSEWVTLSELEGYFVVVTDKTRRAVPLQSFLYCTIRQEAYRIQSAEIVLPAYHIGDRIQYLGIP